MRAVSRLGMRGGRQVVQVGCDIDPGLRFPQFLLRNDMVHGGALPLLAGEIRQLPDQILEALPCQGRNGTARVPLGLRTVAARAGLPELRGAQIGMRVELQRCLGCAVHGLFGSPPIKARERQ